MHRENYRCRCCRVIMNRKISIWPSHIRGARTAARILEKQNRLRVSQVFFSVSVHQPSDGLAFQGFYKAGPRNLRVPDSDVSSPCTHKSKTQTHYAARGVLPGPLTNFGPAKARPLHQPTPLPNPTMLPLALAGLRRGLATKRLFPICPIVPIGAPHAQLFRSASHAQTSVRPVSFRPANSENLPPDE